MTLTYTGQGIGVTRGVAIGRAYLLQRGMPEVVPGSIEENQIAVEIARFRAAVSSAQERLRAVREKIPRGTSRSGALPVSGVASVPRNGSRSGFVGALCAFRPSRIFVVDSGGDGTLSVFVPSGGKRASSTVVGSCSFAVTRISRSSVDGDELADSASARKT